AFSSSLSSRQSALLIRSQYFLAETPVVIKEVSQTPPAQFATPISLVVASSAIFRRITLPLHRLGDGAIPGLWPATGSGALRARSGASPRLSPPIRGDDPFAGAIGPEAFEAGGLWPVLLALYSKGAAPPAHGPHSYTPVI